MKKYAISMILLAFLTVLFLGNIVNSPPASAQEKEHSAKINSLLSLQVESKLRAVEAAPAEAGQAEIFQAMPEEAALFMSQDRQQIFIHSEEMLTSSQMEELESMGLTLYPESWIPPVGSHPTGFIVADMPVDKLDELAAKDYVTTLDTAERYLEAHNDLGTQKINADDVWSANYTGANVTIAVLDSGLDVTHNDIPTPVNSKDYSNYPTLDDIIANQVTGHGTHVTGSALGRGTQSGDVYKGAAPGADLVFLKIGNDTTGSASTAAIVNAIQDAVDTYNADIITMSYGGWGSYHDGSDQMAQAVDYAVSQGAVVFISAGNDGDDDQHYSGNVSASSNTSYIQVNVTNAGTNDTALYYNLVWYDGTGTSNDLELEYYSSNYTLLASTNGSQSESSRGTESELSYYNTYVPPGNSTWYLIIKNNSANSQFFHIYYYLGGSRVKFNSPDPEYTIGSPADADSAIAVGAYNTRQIWYDYANNGWWYPSDPVDQISTFSSRGPRVDTGAPNMPSIVAPGLGIISCRDDDVYPWPGGADSLYIDNDGPNTDNATRNDGSGPADYYMMQGTSMACPIAAGVAALLLEKYPSLTPAQVKAAMESTATDEGAGGFDTTYGYGLIDALAALGTDPVPPTMETIAEAEGLYYNTVPVLSNFGFDDDEALDDGWYQMDSYSGNWTSLFTDVGATSWDSDNWTVPGFAGLSEGSHTIYFMASDNASNVEGESGEWSWQFYKDTSPPDDPTSVNSTSHSLSTWSSDNTVDISWTDATDNLSGLDGYSILWDTDNVTVPDAVKDIEEGSENTTSSELADGNSHYFHIRSVDNLGNWQSTAHLGPFYIETVPPTDPTSVNSTSHSLSTWSSNNTVAITWTDATDNTSGLDGYSILWDTDNVTVPDATKDIEESSENTTSSELASGNNHYFHIRSVDNAGNWQSTVHLGPFYIDTTPPTMEAITEAQGKYYNTAPSFSNFGFDEGSVALDDGWYQMDSYSGNWTALFADVIGTDILDIAAASDNATVYATNGKSTLYRSSDGGVTWGTVNVIDGNTTMDADLVAVAPDDENFIVSCNETTVFVSDDGGVYYWDSLGTVNGIDTINDIALSVESGGNHFVAVAGEDGGAAEVWYYEIGAVGGAWTEASAKTGFDAGDVASAVAFSPNFASDFVMAAITEEDDGGAATDNVSFQVYLFITDTWNTGAFVDFPATIASDDGITGLNSASISMALDYHGAWDTRRHVFVGLTVAGDSGAAATSGIYHLDNDNVTALKTGEQIHSVAYDGTNLVAGEYDSTDVWRSANPMAPTPTVNVTDSSNRPGGENKVVVDWTGSKVATGTSGNLSAFAVSTDNGTSFSDILVITDTSWDNDGWEIPGFAALTNGSHTIYFKASDNLGNIEGESGEWDWQFYKGSPPPSGGGGGGGGGGGAGITPLRPYLDREGKLTEEVIAKSEDFKVEIYLPEGTVALNAIGASISSIRIQLNAEPPLRPKDTSTVALVYDMGPAGTTFDPPVNLTMEYDESKIPEGVAEKTLVVATYDDSTGQWTDLESTVATENDTVTAKVSHFSAFTVLAYTRPASFTIADLSIIPDEIELGETLNISVLVTNDGNLAGSYEVSLKMDDLLVQTKEVTLAGGDAETVSFVITPDIAGEHMVNVGDLAGTCKVEKPKEPAAFIASDLTISPVELLTGGRVTISITLVNTGGLSGTYDVSLKIDGVQIETKSITLDAGKSQKVVFAIIPDTASTYSVDIDGLSGSFVVEEIAPVPAKEEKTAMLAPAVTPTVEPGLAPEQVPKPPINWWIIAGIIVVIAIAGLASYYFIRKKREMV